MGIHINALQAIQHRAARFACVNYEREASVGTMQQQLGWRPLQKRRFIRQAMLFKTVMSVQKTEATLLPKQQTATTLPSYII